MISFCTTTYNRFDYTTKCVDCVVDHPMISEVVISDDCSTDGSYEKLVEYYKSNPKVKIYRNERNMDCYVNKKIAVELATNEWCCLIDSDNMTGVGYIDKLIEKTPWGRYVAYMPSFAAPLFSYQEFDDLLVTKENVASYMGKNMFSTCLNCANYFVNRSEYLRVWDGSVNPHTADSIFQNYNWLNNGNTIFIVKGLSYFHRVHDNSHYKLNNHKTGDFYNQIENKLKQMR